MTQADGQEILIVDGDEKVQKGLGQLLTTQGLVPTVMSDPQRARELVRDKFFAAALIDLDTPTPNAGLELVRWMKQHAPTTAVFVMASRKVFEAAVEAFRAGATDVVVKAPDQVEYLKQRVVESCTEVRGKADEGRLITEVLGVHEDFLKRLMDTSRKVSELEERLDGNAQHADADGETSLLVVEPPRTRGSEPSSRSRSTPGAATWCAPPARVARASTSPPAAPSSSRWCAARCPTFPARWS